MTCVDQCIILPLEKVNQTVKFLFILVMTLRIFMYLLAGISHSEIHQIVEVSVL